MIASTRGFTMEIENGNSASIWSSRYALRLMSSLHSSNRIPVSCVPLTMIVPLNSKSTTFAPDKTAEDGSNEHSTVKISSTVEDGSTTKWPRPEPLEIISNIFSPFRRISTCRPNSSDSVSLPSCTSINTAALMIRIGSGERFCKLKWCSTLGLDTDKSRKSRR